MTRREEIIRGSKANDAGKGEQTEKKDDVDVCMHMALTNRSRGWWPRRRLLR